MSIVCLFPGQGSQSVGMGGELFERFADWTSTADRILGYSIRSLQVGQDDEDDREDDAAPTWAQGARFDGVAEDDEDDADEQGNEAQCGQHD
jgi:malonyl CoA-acyl carrier protein transacylase